MRWYEDKAFRDWAMQRFGEREVRVLWNDLEKGGHKLSDFLHNAELLRTNEKVEAAWEGWRAREVLLGK